MSRGLEFRMMGRTREKEKINTEAKKRYNMEKVKKKKYFQKGNQIKETDVNW